MDSQAVTATQNETDKYTTIVDQVYGCVNEHLKVLINQMINTADNTLFDLAEKATSDDEQMKYMDCTRIFRTEKNDINHHFFINLNNVLNDSSTADDSDGGELELALVEHDEMEEMVAITTMHAKAMNLYGEEVNHMEARLEYLELMCDNSIVKESLDPKHICEIFQNTIENLDIAIEAKLVFYKLFDQEVCSRLGVMYKNINQIFIDNGIMPQIILKTTKEDEVTPEDEDTVSSSVATYYDPQEKIHTDFIPRSQEDFSRIVNEFMAGDMTFSGNELNLPESFIRKPTESDLTGANCYKRKDVVKALSSLQRKINTLGKQNESRLTPEEIKQEVINDISRENGGMVDKKVNLLDERSIDFVGMMFTAIADDETVSEIMTSLIYQLQIPVMKVAMADTSLFNAQKHPARITLNLMTDAGKGINSREDNLFGELENIVDDILQEFDIDIESFEKAVADLHQVIKNEDLLTHETERQQQKQVLQSHAKNIVVDELRNISNQKIIPGNIRPLVLKHWSTLMLNRYIRHGRDSSQWLQSVLLLKLLLKCLQPIKQQSQYDMLKNNHEALIEAMNDELYGTRQDKQSIAEQIDSLKQYFIQTIEENDYKIVDENNVELNQKELFEQAAESTEEELDKIQKQTDIAKQKISQLTSSTKPGVWYEIYNGDNKPVRRLKLSVILTDAAQLIFVDRKGVKVIEKDAEDFAKELEENRSRAIADHSTFEHALGHVMHALAA